MIFRFFLLYISGDELLTERCHTDDLMPSIPVLCLPPSRAGGAKIERLFGWEIKNWWKIIKTIKFKV